MTYNLGFALVRALNPSCRCFTTGSTPGAASATLSPAVPSYGDRRDGMTRQGFDLTLTRHGEAEDE